MHTLVEVHFSGPVGPLMEIGINASLVFLRHRRPLKPEHSRQTG